MAATAQFFAIAELIEATLSHLEPRELLISQRVNDMFRGVVQGSKKLQKALFIAPASGSPAIAYGHMLGEIDPDTGLLHAPTTRDENDQTGLTLRAYYQTRMLARTPNDQRKYTVDRSPARSGF